MSKFCKKISFALLKITITFVTLAPHLPTHIPELKISQSTPIIRIGETVTLMCDSNEPSAVLSWTKDRSHLADNIQTSGGILRVNSVRYDNIGIYKCEARGQSGYYSRDYSLDVSGK